MAKNPKKSEAFFEVRSLREQVYEYLRNEMYHGRMEPGSFINLKDISQRLGISKTPLRDALIQLECEGFVNILPRRGVLIKKLTIEDVKNILMVVGALESAVILSVFDKIGPKQINRLEALNRKMIAAVEREDFATYYRLNIDFHNVFLDLNENTDLQRIVTPLNSGATVTGRSKPTKHLYGAFTRIQKRRLLRIWPGAKHGPSATFMERVTLSVCTEFFLDTA